MELSVPHIGWNGFSAKKPSRIFNGFTGGEKFYFVHSYYPSPDLPETILGETLYGKWFASVLTRENLVAMQFHPEKSGRPGLKIISNFCCWSGEEYAE